MRAFIARPVLTIAFGCMLAWPAMINVEVPEWVGQAREIRNVFLRIDDVRLGPHADGVVRIYMNLPDATWKTGTDNDHYLGYFSIVPRNSREVANGVYRKMVVVDISAARSKFAGLHSIEVTLVPAAQAATESKSELRVGGVHITAR